MSLDVKGQKCVVCSAYLFSDDDIVYCPECGAPHHRDCYKTMGHCGLEELHGTEQQYKKPETPEKGEQAEHNPPKNTAENKTNEHRCRACGTELDVNARFCPNCGLSSDGSSPFNSFSPFTQAVEIKDDALVAEDVTALEAAKIVRVNPFRYIPKFISLSENRKTSWNWAAFLMPNAWFAYRKMYKESIISTVLMIMSLIFNVPFNLSVMQLPLSSSGETVNTYIELAQYYTEHLAEIGVLPLVLATVGMALSLIIRIVCGIYGDWIYRNRVVFAAHEIRKADDENKEAANRKFSGISFIGFMIAVCAMEFIPAIITMFII